MSENGLEKFLRIHAPTYTRKPWLPLEEQVCDAFEEAVRDATDDAHAGMYDEDEKDDIVHDAKHEERQEIADDVLAILQDDDLSNNQKMTKIEEYFK